MPSQTHLFDLSEIAKARKIIMVEAGQAKKLAEARVIRVAERPADSSQLSGKSPGENRFARRCEAGNLTPAPGVALNTGAPA
jgi:hypothetical protein